MISFTAEFELISSGEKSYTIKKDEKYKKENLIKIEDILKDIIRTKCHIGDEDYLGDSECISSLTKGIESSPYLFKYLRTFDDPYGYDNVYIFKLTSDSVDGSKGKYIIRWEMYRATPQIPGTEKWRKYNEVYHVS